MNKSFSFFILTVFLGLTLISCSTKKVEKLQEEVEHSDLKKDYEVRDAALEKRPGWIENPEIWAKEYGHDVATYRYYAFETEPKIGKTLACDLAKAKVRADVAGEINTFISSYLSAITEGQDGGSSFQKDVKALKEYVESGLNEKIQGHVQGAAIVRTYWEKRQYLRKLGAEKDLIAYTCAIFVSISRQNLDSAINFAKSQLQDKAKTLSVQEKVKEAINQMDKKFQETL